MTFRPEQVGDKGQRFQVKFNAATDSLRLEERTLGYAGTREGAEQMAAVWRKHPEGYYVWVVDRNHPINREWSEEPVP